MIYIIPGVYKSGTTVVAKAMHEAGIPMWDWAAPYCEDADIWGINAVEQLTNPYDPNFMPYRHEASEGMKKNLERFKVCRWLGGKCGDWGFKEPRVAQFGQAYIEAFPDAKWIFCIRNPLNTVWSQRKAQRVHSGDRDALAHSCQYIMNFLALANIHGLDLHLFNYDGDMEREKGALEEFVGRPLNFKWEHKVGVRV